MTEVAMVVVNKRYLRKTANINVKTEFIYKRYIPTDRKQQKLEL